MKKAIKYFMSIISVCAIVTCGGWDGGGDSPPSVTSTSTHTDPPSASSTQNVTFSDDFSHGLSAWTQTDGTWSVVDGYLQGSPSSQSVNIYYNTPTNTTSQWIQAKFKNINDSDDFMGMILWAPSNLSYTSQLYCQYQAGKFLVGYNDSQGYDHTYSPVCYYTLADGHYVGFEASGTPSSVTMKIYDNGTSPAARPWPNPICTWTNLNASGYTYGKYVGLWVYHTQKNYSYDAFGPVNGGDQ